MTLPLITSPQIALSRDGRVDLWCHVEKHLPEGGVQFYVINGAWIGKFDGATACVIDDGTWGAKQAAKAGGWPAELVWQGKAPFGEGSYNEAIRWIEEQRRDAVPMEVWLAEQGYDPSWVFGEQVHD